MFLPISRFPQIALLTALLAWPSFARADDTDLAARARALDPRPEAHMTLSELERRTAAGDLKAQAELGSRYGLGYGVKQDIPKAVELLKAAAAKGDPDAEFFLGTAYSNGLGVPASEIQAFTLFEQAAEQGHAGGNYMVASMIISGKAGISPSWSGAIANLWAASVKNYPPAMMLLGAAYQSGDGVPLNLRAAAYWYRRYLSLVGPDPRAIYNLRLMINAGMVPWEEGDPGDQPVAVYPLETAADYAKKESEEKVTP